VGRLFASQRDNGQRTEIVLAVTPHIIRNVRRPDLNETEFWSGTENDIRSRPLAPVPVAAAEAAPTPLVIAPLILPNPNGSLAPGQAPRAALATDGAAVSTTLPVLRFVAPSEVKAGETFIVEVVLKSEQSLRGLPLQLLFDKKLMTALDPVEGIYFKSDGAGVSNSKSVEQAEGRVAMAVMRNGVDGLPGDGAVAAFRFKAVSAGSAEFRLAPTSAIGNGMPLPLVAPAPVRVAIK
jgi:general secretion pathway protein D